MYKKIIPYINCEHEITANIYKEATGYEYGGADEIYVFNYSKDETSIHEFLGTVKELTKIIDIPIYIGCYAKKFEDIKKGILYRCSICYHKIFSAGVFGSNKRSFWTIW